ncbi:MAG: cytochrome c oxidase assembly protein [Geminicoccaceae bacterium]|jgi:putative membrane protein|nr:cytochrome c oxidase assembly protein [Geminicoccaceae bacterium]
MSRLGAAAVGGLLLVAAWAGPLAAHAASSFTAHMAIHVTVIAIAAPLLAFAMGPRFALARRCPLLFAPLVASLLDIVAIWGWHAPAPHVLARTSALGFALEQLSFLAVALLVWTSALGAGQSESRAGQAAGVGALLFTSMHMTLLGALFALAPRELFAREICGSAFAGLTALQDQQLGGTLMLALGGASYLAGALYLLARLLSDGALGARDARHG